jgi:hypothetical protein
MKEKLNEIAICILNHFGSSEDLKKLILFETTNGIDSKNKMVFVTIFFMS